MTGLQAGLLDGRAYGPYTLEVDHKIRSQEFTRPFLLDLRLHVLGRDLDVLCLYPWERSDFLAFLGKDRREVIWCDRLSGILKQHQPSIPFCLMSDQEHHELTVLEPYLTHCQSCTRAISAVAASSMR